MDFFSCKIPLLKINQEKPQTLTLNWSNLIAKKKKDRLEIGFHFLQQI